MFCTKPVTSGGALRALGFIAGMVSGSLTIFMTISLFARPVN